MKIVCDNCGAKYSIADEKVAGKVFKIRCKKCTNVIVVRGDQVHVQEQEAAAGAGYDYGGDAVWHVVVDGDQQGPFAPQQLGQMITEGTIDWEAYVWKEGFEGWQPARDVPDLVAAITGESAPAEQPAAAAPAAAAPAGGGDMGADPFAAADPGGSPFGGSEAARAGGGDAGADLFAQSDPAASPFGAGPDDDVVASAPSPRVSADQASMTGQRNENSVLFSLSNLQALATGGPSGGGGGAPAAAPGGGGGGGGGPAPGHATGEGSGLIDIRALASATSSIGGGDAAPAASSGGATDDLLSIGGGGGLGGSLGAPVLAPAAAEPEQGNKKLMIAAGVGGVVVVGLLVALIVVLLQKPEPTVMADATQQINAPNAAAAPAVSPSAEPPAAGAPTPGSPTPTGDDDGDDEAEDEGDDGDDSSSMRRRGGGHRSSMSSSSSSGSSSSSSSMSEPSAPPARMVSSNSSIDDLLNSALGGGSMRAAMAAPAMSNLPAQPGRDDVGRALRGVSSRVGSCGGGTAGVANAAIVFASSGRVRSVRVTGVPPNVQSCVSRAVRAARIPPFSRPTFNVNFPFRVR